MIYGYPLGLDLLWYNICVSHLAFAPIRVISSLYQPFGINSDLKNLYCCFSLSVSTRI